MTSTQPNRTRSGDAAFFSGPASTKATVSAVATALATLFWTIMARTVFKTTSVEDLALYIATSATIVTGLVGFVVPESGAFAEHTTRRLAELAATREAATSPVGEAPAREAASAMDAVDARLQAVEAMVRSLRAEVMRLEANGSAIKSVHS